MLGLYMDDLLTTISFYSIWYSCNGIAQVIAPLIMYGIGKTNTRVAQWQLMFLVCGAATIVVGIVFLVLMPSGPESAWFLTPDERILAKRRLQLESDAGDQKSFSFPQFKEAVLDVRTWLYIAFGIFIVLPSPVLVVSPKFLLSLPLSQLCRPPSDNSSVCLFDHQLTRLRQIRDIALYDSLRSSPGVFHLGRDYPVPDLPSSTVCNRHWIGSGSLYRSHSAIQTSTQCGLGHDRCILASKFCDPATTRTWMFSNEPLPSGLGHLQHFDHPAKSQRLERPWEYQKGGGQCSLLCGILAWWHSERTAMEY